MPIIINAPQDSGFDNPLGLLSDCHRRIEKFLQQLILVTQELHGGPLDFNNNEALTVALRYFKQAAPMHTEDEEVSLFPRLRQSGSAEAQAALAAIAALEADHDTADMGHAEADRLGRLWIEHNSLTPENADRLLQILMDLKALYTHHIGVEDTQIFPMAAKALTENDLVQIGREMAYRRDLDPDNLPLGNRCAQRRGQSLPGA